VRWCDRGAQTASRWLQANNRTAMIISPISSAPVLADEVAYPNVARLATSEQPFQLGTVRLPCAPRRVPFAVWWCAVFRELV